MGQTLFEQQLQKKIIILDGAMGTMLQAEQLTAADFGGEAYEGCNEYLTLTRPNIVEKIHRAYFSAGADVVETNTFGATKIVLDEYNLGHLAEELNFRAAQIAKKVAAEFSTEAEPRFVAGSMGPTTKTLSVTGGATFEQIKESYEEQARGLIRGNVDLLLLETSQDLLNVKAAFLGISAAFEQLQKKVPLIISGTIEPMGTTLAGQSIEAFYISVEHMSPVAVGLNCATGPEFMSDHLRALSKLATSAVSCYPNAGLPDEEGHYHESPQTLSAKMKAFAEKGWINVAGGCCGTTPAHIKALKNALTGIKPRRWQSSHPHAVSGIEPFVYEDQSVRPLFVGERTNVIGSRKFKRLIAEGKYEEASEIARAQVKNGAHIIDICLADPDREELEDMEAFVQEVVKKVKVPLMIDSTDDAVIEKAFTYIQGKSIINSVNLENGEERFEKISPLVRKYGGALVVGTIDETGMAVTAKRKLEVALRSYQLLVEKYHIPPNDIIFDPLVFPAGTGDEQYFRAAKETVEGIRLIKEKLPQCQTILGISNVSFGLPPAGREVLNSVFLYHCTKAGLDYAIVNTEKLERFASISEKENKLAEELLFATSEQALTAFTDFYRDKKKTKKVVTQQLSLSERLAHYVIEGTKEGLLDDLVLALNEYPTPLAIINGPLMAGMAEVGRLFNDNQLIVAEVLQSAEVMKTSVAFLEQYMEKKEDGSGKGKIILATVKGDVHDIGKNLVDIILSNNGYHVVDLGIKVAPADLIATVKKEKPDLIGLSGLLVKSAQQMVVTAQDLKEAGIEIPILVGGAALSRKFTVNKISPEYEGIVLYAKDAMDGLALSNRLQKEEERAKIIEETIARRLKQEKIAQTIVKPDKKPSAVKSQIKEAPVFSPADCKRHVLRNYDISYIEPYVNMEMLLGHHLGLKGKVGKLLAEGDEKALALKQRVHQLIADAKKEHLIEPAAVYQFFPAQSQGNDVIIYDPENPSEEIERFSFPRQEKASYLCLADYLRPKDRGKIDYVGMFAVVAGKNIREHANRLKEDGHYFESHALQAAALEFAEGFAERVHQLMRDQWGFPDAPDFTMQERFQAKYQGQRFSFGYPACPNLEDQTKLFNLLKPEQIGLHLTEGFMMEPEAAVTAIVFSHPEARYFNVL
ncbi:methionine synthase [Bacillaceae bacterium Marseille-Q3522]|nr:methionine synthase [Bacillaceae bacterium Marseille-Q3522]